MKKSQGISLISLIITIVVILILVGISIFNGLTENVDEAGNTLDYNEIFEVSEAVSQRALFNKLNSESYKLVGDNTQDFAVTFEQLSGDQEIEVEKIFKGSEGWYLITKDESEELNLDKVRRDYLVNYDTGEVVSFDAIKYEGKKYYTASELRDAIRGGEIIVSPNRYDEEKGVNKPYVVSGMVPVKRVGSDWVVTNVDDTEWYDYASTDVSGTMGNLWANVMLMDEIEVAGMTNEAVRNATISELEGNVVTTEGSMFVWIPRYSRGLVDSQMQIVYSRLTEDYFKGAANTVAGAFEDNGIELTGIWVSKYDAGYIER